VSVISVTFKESFKIIQRDAQIERRYGQR